MIGSRDRKRKERAPMSGAGRRVFVVAGIRLFREGLAAALQREFGFAVIGTAPSAAEAVTALRARRADVVLVDAVTPDAADAHGLVAAVQPTAQVVTLGTPRLVSLAELASALGDPPPGIAGQLLRRVTGLAAARPGPGDAALTRREREIVALIDEGLSNKEIAGRLVIEVATVKNHVHNILEKLRVGSRGEAAAVMRRGIERAA
jgi:two-component system nitrate/nitrite response regulator NarL